MSLRDRVNPKTKVYSRNLKKNMTHIDVEDVLMWLAQEMCCIRAYHQKRGKKPRPCSSWKRRMAEVHKTKRGDE